MSKKSKLLTLILILIFLIVFVVVSVQVYKSVSQKIYEKVEDKIYGEIEKSITKEIENSLGSEVVEAYNNSPIKDEIKNEISNRIKDFDLNKLTDGNIKDIIKEEISNLSLDIDLDSLNDYINIDEDDEDINNEEEESKRDEDEEEEENNEIDEDNEEDENEEEDETENDENDRDEENNEIDYNKIKDISENTYSGLNREDYDSILSGTLFSSQTWSGNILIEGDLIIPNWVDITIEPGTRIEFTKSNDKTPSPFHIEIPADGFNDDDPSRLKPYMDDHISVFINGKFTAIGTEDNPIIFTSNEEDKYYNDWSTLVLNTDDAYLDNVIIEYCQACLAVVDPSENIIVKNSIIRHGFWGCFSIANSNGLYENNVAQDCGHEGFDIRGNPRLINNEIKDSHTSIFILGGEPVFENNRVQNYAYDINDNEIRDGLEVIEDWNCDEEDFWRYDNYIIPCKSEPFVLS